MWNVKWFSAFFFVVNIRGSMIVGNYRNRLWFAKRAINKQNWISLSIANVRRFLFDLIVPETRSPHDLSNNFWHELSSPFTDSSDEFIGETTTHVHEPFFEENSTQINITTQLGSDIYLHCRVNDLREKMVSKVFFLQIINHRDLENVEIGKVSDVP